jgi:hypothetical protein
MSNGHEVGTGSGFLTKQGLVTNSHTSRPAAGSTFVVRRETGAEWQMPAQEAYERKLAESPEHHHDYAVLSLEGAPGGFEPSDLLIDVPAKPPVGRRVAYLGYPFGAKSLVVSSGYVASVEVTTAFTTVLRVDGSVNRGNSGGPLFDLETGQLLAIVSRAETGMVLQQFAELKAALEGNVQVLSAARGMMSLSGFDPVEGIRASMAAVAEVARHLERSANVGIGFAFLVDHLAASFAS